MLFLVNLSAPRFLNCIFLVLNDTHKLKDEISNQSFPLQ